MSVHTPGFRGVPDDEWRYRTISACKPGFNSRSNKKSRGGCGYVEVIGAGYGYYAITRCRKCGKPMRTVSGMVKRRKDGSLEMRPSRGHRRRIRSRRWHWMYGRTPEPTKVRW